MRSTIRTHLHAIVLATTALAATPVHATPGSPVPIAIGHTLDALECHDLPTAKRLLAPPVACSNPEALMLWGSLHDSDVERPDGRHHAAQYCTEAAEAAIAVNTRAYLALARDAAYRHTTDGYTDAYAHLIAYGWTKGITDQLRSAMRRTATHLRPGDVLLPYERAERWRTLRDAGTQHIPCAHAHTWL